MGRAAFASNRSSGGKGAGILRLKLTNSPQFCGIESSRGSRSSNQDSFQLKSIRLNGTGRGENDIAAKEVLFFGLFDGHGGQRASQFCATRLHELFVEEHQKLLVQEVAENAVKARTDYRWYQSVIERSIYSSFKRVDAEFLASHPPDTRDGTTASIVVLHTVTAGQLWPEDYANESNGAVKENLRDPNQQVTVMTVGHVGDSRVLLCSRGSGRALQLTTDHVPSLLSERIRIQAAGGFIATDSFGQLATLGFLGTTRSIGIPVIKHKYNWQDKDILTATPDVFSRALDSTDLFLVLCTDGVCGVVSNQEIVDIVKSYSSPSLAAKNIVDYAERCGAEDNCTSMVIRLEGMACSSSSSCRCMSNNRLACASDSSRNKRLYR